MQCNFVKLFIYLKKILKKKTKTNSKKGVVLLNPFPQENETEQSYFENRHENKLFREIKEVINLALQLVNE